MIARIIRWLARHEIEAMRADMDADSAAKILEAYRVGVAHGEGAGRNQMVGELNRLIDERHDLIPQVTEEDLSRVTKGVLH